MRKPTSEGYELDLGRYELRRADGVKVKLERQPMELLIYLVSKRHQLVTRDELVARLWPADISVDTEPGINNAIRKIRLALHDSPETPRYIETVVGKGYRFIGDLPIVGAPTPAELHRSVAAPERQASDTGTRRKHWLVWAIAATIVVLVSTGLWTRRFFHREAIFSLAVLPLQNLTGDAAQNYFADGITEELTSTLARIGSIRVISRTSSMQYADRRESLPQIAKELNVDAVIEGSVVRSGNKVRVTAQLIDGRRDTHLWAQSYERNLGDILELQDSLTIDIATQVRASLTADVRGTFRSHHQTIPEAYEAYLHGRSEIAKQSQQAMRNSVGYFQKAIELDPMYSEAYAGLADSFSLLGNYAVLPPRDTFPQAAAAARKALELDPMSAEAHAALAFAKHHFEWDWPGAETEYKRALELAPSLALARLRYAEYLSNSGRHDEAVREIDRARELDPLSLTIANNVGRILFYARRYSDTIQELQSVLVLHPDRTFVRIYLGKAYEQRHMYREALAEFNRVTDLMGGEPGVGLAHVYAASGQNSAAKRILSEHVEIPNEGGVLDWVFVAGVYTALGDQQRALVWLEKAYENRDFFLTYLKVDPDLDPLRPDPHFRQLVDRIGIPGGQ